jgi:hypothetical protein
MGTFVRGVPGVIKYKMRLLAVGSQLGRPWSKAEVSSIKKLAILIVPTCCLPAGRQDRQGFWIAEWEIKLIIGLLGHSELGVWFQSYGNIS